MDATLAGRLSWMSLERAPTQHHGSIVHSSDSPCQHRCELGTRESASRGVPYQLPAATSTPLPRLPRTPMHWGMLCNVSLVTLNCTIHETRGFDTLLSSASQAKIVKPKYRLPAQKGLN